MVDRMVDGVVDRMVDRMVMAVPMPMLRSSAGVKPGSERRGRTLDHLAMHVSVIGLVVGHVEARHEQEGHDVNDHCRDEEPRLAAQEGKNAVARLPSNPRAPARWLPPHGRWGP
jgi:hypothetical protein